MSVNIVELLELYKSYPCLWDKSHSDFKNRVKREEAEQALLPKTGLGSIRELRQKIRSIRCTYNQEVAKIRASVRAGLGPDEMYTPKLPWFPNADKFLRKNLEGLDFELNPNYNTLGEGSSIMEYEYNRGEVEATAKQQLFPINNINEHDDSLENSLRSSIQQAYNNHNDAFHEQPVNHIDPPGPSSSRTSNSWHMRKRKTRAVDETVDCAVKVLHELSNRRVRNSEFTVFGDHVATQLQQLPLESALQVQQEIQSLITKARLDALRNAALTTPSTRTNSPSSPPDTEREDNGSLQIHFHVGVR